MSTISPQRIASLLARRDEVQAMLATGNLAADKFVALSKEYAEVEPVAVAAAELQRLRAELIDLEAMADDPEMRDMAAEEAQAIRETLPAAERALALSLLPKDAADERSAMLEVRAGTGGDEAALFAGDLFRMYQRYAEGQGWKVELISASSAEMGGYKEVVASVTGKGVFARMKFESGVHRVQRVPVTESGGAFTPPPRPLRFCQRLRKLMSRLMTRICGLIFTARPALVGSQSTQLTLRCGSSIFLRALSSSSKMKNRSIRIRPRLSACCGRGCMSLSVNGSTVNARAIARRWSARVTAASASAPIISHKAA